MGTVSSFLSDGDDVDWSDESLVIVPGDCHDGDGVVQGRGQVGHGEEEEEGEAGGGDHAELVGHVSTHRRDKTQKRLINFYIKGDDAARNENISHRRRRGVSLSLANVEEGETERGGGGEIASYSNDGSIKMMGSSSLLLPLSVP